MKKYDASPGLEGGYESAACRSQASFRGAVKSTVACSTGSIGLRSAPPPNHALVVTMWRVFMCTAGTRGERRCATREIPLAQNRGSSSAPGICRANSGEKRPNTVERSEEHTSELQSLMRISYAVFCLKKKKTINL